MKTIKMRRTAWGYPDGYTAMCQYDAGSTVTTTDDLAAVFLQAGHADLAEAPAEAPPAPAVAIAPSAPPAAVGDAPQAEKTAAPKAPRHLSGAKDKSLSAKD